jgi:hypothetical protein
VKKLAVACTLLILGCTHASMRVTPDEPRVLSEVSRGREAFLQLHCNACHRVGGDDALPATTKIGTRGAHARLTASRRSLFVRGMFRQLRPDAAAHHVAEIENGRIGDRVIDVVAVLPPADGDFE